MKNQLWLKTFLIILAANFLLYSECLACINDYECGYGNRCVKASGSMGYQGVCIEPVNNMGIKNYSSSNGYGSSSGVQEVEGCSFDTDCPINFSCLKRSGDLKGICAR